MVTGPGSANVKAGEMVTMKPYGAVVDDMVIRFPAGLKCALGENPKRVYGSHNKMPATRMATAALLRQTLVEAQNYLAKQEKPGQRRPFRNAVCKWRRCSGFSKEKYLCVFTPIGQMTL